MKIFIANDHTGILMKQTLVKFLQQQDYEVEDLGVNQDGPSNYALLGIELGQKVASTVGSLGIAICGTGIGISIAANKVKTVRAALCYEVQTAILAREHNDANVLALGSRFIADYKALTILEAFLKTSFEKGRHQERVDILNLYE